MVNIFIIFLCVFLLSIIILFLITTDEQNKQNQVLNSKPNSL